LWRGRSSADSSGVTEQGGRDVAKIGVVVLAVGLDFAFISTAAVGQVSGGSQPDLQAPFLGSALTCAQTESEKIAVPNPIAMRAQLKARLLNLLRLSLFDDAKGIVNIKRENEIKKLASELKNDKAD
jgi:hypothetical protein